jgi:hypothetical protein
MTAPPAAVVTIMMLYEHNDCIAIFDTLSGLHD